MRRFEPDLLSPVVAGAAMAFSSVSVVSNAPPMAKVTVAFDPDNPGRWLMHCHNLYHQATGMMTEVAYV
jgi:FtsP/CotA-like multicopper oxidase with cupredoxin domain